MKHILTHLTALLLTPLASLHAALLLNRPARALIRAALLIVTLLVAKSAEAADPVTIVAFGASTTAARGSTKIYAAILQDELRNVRIINAGVSGNTTEMARKRFEQDVLKKQEGRLNVKKCLKCPWNRLF